MASTISANIARTRPTDPTTPPSSNARTEDKNETRLLFQAERDRDSFVRVSAASIQNIPDRPGRLLEGFDSRKMNDPSVNTPKYLVGRILQNYPNTPEGLRQALPEIQRHFPEARIAGNKGDLLDFGSHTDPEGRPLGKIDVIRAAGGPNGGEAWQWLPVDQGGGAGASGGGGAGEAGAAGGSKGARLPGGISLAELFAFLASPEGQQLLEAFLGQRQQPKSPR